jgi:protein TonB
MIAVLDRADLSRWGFSALVIATLHAALILTLTRWHEPVIGNEGTDSIIMDLAPFPGPTKNSRSDLAPGPEQQQSQSAPETPRPQAEHKPEKTEPLPPLPDAEVQIPLERKSPEKPVEQTPPVPETTAPPRPRPSAAAVASWHRKIALQLERHKGYPAAARMRRETGTAELAFTLDRGGKVLASRVAQSSGSTALDQEAIDTVRRAQPFPPPPPDMPENSFDFTVPIRFNVR